MSIQTNSSLINLRKGVHYFEGSNFTVIFNQTIYIENSGFGGIVTAVQSNPKITNNCFNKYDEFSTFNLKQGYTENTVSLGVLIKYLNICLGLPKTY